MEKKMASTGFNKKSFKTSAQFESSLKEDFLYGDPLTKLILKKWRMPMWLPPLIFILDTALVLFGIGGLLGYIGSHAGTYGIMDYPGQLIVSFIFQPFMITYHIWLSPKIWGVFESLLFENVVKEQSERNYKDQIQHISSTYNSRIVIWFSVIVSILVNYWMTIMVFNLEFGNFWMHQIRWVYLVFELPKSLITTYVTIFTAIRIFIIYIGFQRIYKKVEIRVQPLHSDNAGGLASIGALILSHVYWAIAVATFPVAGSIINYFKHTDLGTYLVFEFFVLPILAFTVFFLPLQSTHSAMRQCARNELAELSKLYENLSRSIKTNKGELTENNLNILSKMIDTSERIKKIYPVWPFNASILQKFFVAMATSFTPLALSLIEISLRKIIQ